MLHPRSVEYYGLVFARTYQPSRELSHPAHTLRKIFSADPNALASLLAATGGGQVRCKH